MTMERAYMIIAMLILAAVALAALNVLELRENRKLHMRNATLYERCEQLADENATLYSDTKKLRTNNAVLSDKLNRKDLEIADLLVKNEELCRRSFGVMMSGWRRIKDDGRVYYEKDQIRLIVEDGKVVGWYRPEAEATAPAEVTADDPEEVTDAVDRAEK